VAPRLAGVAALATSRLAASRSTSPFPSSNFGAFGP
jgi:hypothetical protein